MDVINRYENKEELYVFSNQLLIRDPP